MNRRYQQSLTASPASAPAPTDCGERADCKCCAAIRVARERTLFDPLPEYCSPLSPGVQLVNLSRSRDGSALRVDLGEDWARMFTQLPHAGVGLLTTRNEASILGRLMTYPELCVTSSGGKGANGEQGLWINFGHLASARAIHQRQVGRNIFGVEFADGEGLITHRFTLTPESDFDAFFDWVRLHQDCTAAPANHFWAEEAEGDGEERHAVQRPSDAGALASIFAACVRENLSVRATVLTGAVRQRATFAPKSVVALDDWWCASDGATSLHFAPGHFATAQVVESSSHDDLPLLRCSTETHQPALLLEAGDGTPAAIWRDLMEDLA